MQASEAKHPTTTRKGHVGYIEIGDLPVEPVEFIDLVYDLTDICEKLKLNEEIRVVVLNVLGNDFFVPLAEKDETALEVDDKAQACCRDMTVKIADLDMPVIACISGNAIGLYLELALACDIRVAREESQFGLPHIRKGLIPWAGGTQRLLRIVGKSKALEMVLTGDIIDAAEAHRIGLVNRVVPFSALKKTVSDLAREMGRMSPVSLSYAKEAIHKGMDLTLYQGLRLEADLYYLIHTTGDREEGIRAFQGKRKARFEGE
jgi:enoyl-CoA hydratase/carnithine racemase